MIVNILFQEEPNTGRVSILGVYAKKDVALKYLKQYKESNRASRDKYYFCHQPYEVIE